MFIKLWERREGTTKQRRMDEEKRGLCKEAGIDLVEIICLWNGSEEELIREIRGVKEDFLSEVEEYKKIKPSEMEVEDNYNETMKINRIGNINTI